jgi:nucleoside-diphosphate-sugar epimerase
MTVLVTGSSGHLGEALMRTLRASGRAAFGLDVIPGPFTDEVGSIADRASVARVMTGVDTVLHAATLHKPHVATHSREAFVETNILGTLILLEEAARPAGVSARRRRRWSSRS